MRFFLDSNTEGACGSVVAGSSLLVDCCCLEGPAFLCFAGGGATLLCWRLVGLLVGGGSGSRSISGFGATNR